MLQKVKVVVPGDTILEGENWTSSCSARSTSAREKGGKPSTASRCCSHHEAMFDEHRLFQRVVPGNQRRVTTGDPWGKEIYSPEGEHHHGI